MQNYKLIKVDVSENNNEQIKTMKKFNVFGPPVLIFFENGKEKLKITGFISADDLLKNRTMKIQSLQIGKIKNYKISKAHLLKILT